jgi:hypothetical protein
VSCELSKLAKPIAHPPLPSSVSPAPQDVNALLTHCCMAHTRLQADEGW